MEDLMTVLGEMMQRYQLSAGDISALSGVPRRSVLNWLGGKVRKPQQWQAVVRVAAALRLNENETNRLLQSAGHPMLTTLRQESLEQNDRQLLSGWPEPTPPPFQAMPEVPYFVRYDKRIEKLKDELRRGRNVTIYSFRGMGGVGKTSLAVHLAYQLREVFPDGVLWARLDVSDTMSILAQFANTYGEDVSAYRDIETRATAVRNILAYKKALLILDNAQQSEQVRPLLPPSTGQAAVIVTTRQDLAVADEMIRYIVEPFAPDSGESLAVFTYFLGEQLVQRRQKDLQEIADILGHLPLAIAIAGGKLSTQITISDYLQRLQEENRQMDELNREDRSVRLTFRISYESLPPNFRKFFVSLGVFGGIDFDIVAVSHITETDSIKANENLSTLIAYSLVQQTSSTRFQLHPLLRQYVRELSYSIELREKVTWYYVNYANRNAGLWTALQPELTNIMFALQESIDIQIPEATVTGFFGVSGFLLSKGQYSYASFLHEQAKNAAERLSDNSALLKILISWAVLQQQMGNLDKAKQLFEKSKILFPLVDDRLSLMKSLINAGNYAFASGYRKDAQDYWLTGLAIAKEINSPNGIITSFSNLGILSMRTIDNYSAERYFLDGLELSRKVNRERMIPILHNQLGQVYIEMGKYKDAYTHLQKGLVIAKQMDLQKYLGMLLGNLGYLQMNQGKYDEAINSYQDSLHLLQQVKELALISAQLARLAHVFVIKRRFAEASYLCQEGFKYAEEAQDSFSLSSLYRYKGMIAREQKQFGQARLNFQESIILANSLNDYRLVIEVEIEWAELFLKEKEFEEAKALYGQVLEKANTFGLPREVARVLYGIARAEFFLGHISQSFEFGYQSLQLLEKINHTLANDVRLWLDGLTHSLHFDGHK